MSFQLPKGCILWQDLSDNTDGYSSYLEVAADWSEEVFDSPECSLHLIYDYDKKHEINVGYGPEFPVCFLEKKVHCSSWKTWADFAAFFPDFAQKWQKALDEAKEECEPSNG